MSYSILRLSLLLVIALAFNQNLLAQDQAIPQLSSAVTDVTGTLTTQEINRLSAELQTFANTKGSQIAVLIIPTTDPEDIASYSMRVAESWKIGREGTDDGVILLVAKNDRKLRIEVGYGLEGAIPDVYAKRIIENIILPRFRQGEFNRGIENGVEAIIGLIQGEDLPAITQASGNESSDKKSVFITILLGVLFTLSILKAFIKNKKIKWAVVGVVSIAVGLILGSIIFGGIGFVLSSFLMFSSGGSSGSGRYYGGGGFTGGGGFSGGGSSFGGGGFSGGGGSFGGGGASGGW